MTSEVIVDVNGLARRFGDLVAVRDVSLRINAGEVFGVLGPNGAGKSTVIRMLCGILAPSAGGGTVLGHDLVSAGEAIKSGIGYMTQAFSLYADLSIEENLRFYAGIHSMPFLRLTPRIEEQIARFNLDERRHQIVGTLSGGWRQRVALACATVHRPRLLVLDEPTAGVDPVSRREFWQLIGTIAREGAAVLATTHYMDEAERFDRLAFIFRGSLLGTGTPAELITRSGLRVAEGEVADAPALAASLATDARIVEAAVHGRAVRIIARDQAAIPPGLTAARVTIEDAFVALTRSEEGGRS
ncbi:MAG: ABC transporter ATP-binding protein [Planctomycetota bacterium]